LREIDRRITLQGLTEAAWKDEVKRNKRLKVLPWLSLWAGGVLGYLIAKP